MMEQAASTAESNFVNYHQGKIHYLKFGHGSKTMIALHGFSENAHSYLELAPALAEKYTVLSIDVPYHGQTEWPMGEPFDQQDMLQVLEMICVKEDVNQFSMFGFSMGGRITLSLLPALHPQIEQVFLAAPDGIKTQKVFDVAVYPAWGRWLFRVVSKKPGLFFFLLRILRQWGRISKFMYEFTTNHMDTREKRDRIYYTWVTLKNFTPDVEALKRWLNEKQLPVHLFFGETDEVIRPEVGRYFQEGLHHCTLDVIPKGHKLIDPELIPFLKPYL